MPEARDGAGGVRGGDSLVGDDDGAAGGCGAEGDAERVDHALADDDCVGAVGGRRTVES